MTHWFSPLDLDWPGWSDYREPIEQLARATGGQPHLPTARHLQTLLPAGVCNHRGQAIRFRNSAALSGLNYEEHIYRTGEVSTRENNWHDMFNALAWSRIPRLKSAMNALHFQEIRERSAPGRGPVRDALTLFDECGVLVVASSDAVLDELAQHAWDLAFRRHASAWRQDVRVFICGHALLEKFLRPYKAMTAHALLLRLDAEQMELDRNCLFRQLDAQVAKAALAGRLLGSSAGLSPLPLMGIPGWWPNGEQGEAFYSDHRVFRPLSMSPRKSPTAWQHLSGAGYSTR